MRLLPFASWFAGLRQRQAAVLAQGFWAPTVPLSLCNTAGSLQLPSLLQMVQVGFGSCVSWRKRQTEHLILRNFEKGTPDSMSPCSAEHPPFPSSRTIDSRRKVNSQALPWPFLRMLLGQTTSTQRGTTLPSLLLTSRRTGRGKNPGSVYAEDSRLSGLNSPSKSAPNRDATPGGREKGKCYQRGGTLQDAGKVVQLSTTPWSTARIICKPRCLHHSTRDILYIYREARDGAWSIIMLLHHSRARPPATRALRQESDGNRGVIPRMKLVLMQQELHFCLKSHS